MSKHNSSHLNDLTLILNASYLPLGICSSKRAICLYFLNKVDILMNYDHHIHSPSMQMRVPSVIKLKKYYLCYLKKFAKYQPFTVLKFLGSKKIHSKNHLQNFFLLLVCILRGFFQNLLLSNS